MATPGSFFGNMFNRTAAPAPAAPVPATQTTQQAQIADPAAQQTAQTTSSAESSPLDQFAALWQNDTKSQEQQVDPNKIFNVDSKALNAQVKQMNFLGTIPPKVQEALKAGGEDAVKANLYLMNQASQSAFAQVTQLVPNIIEAALAKQSEQFESRVAEVVRKNALSNTLIETNPIAANPAAQPIVQLVQQAILQKHPNATPQQMAEMTGQYLNNFAQAVQAPQQRAAEAEKQKQNASTDFSAFF